MTLQEITNKLSTIRKGRFVKACWKSVNGGYEKISNGVIRFVSYSKIKGVVISGKQNPNETKLNEFVYHNSNTNCDYIQLATTKHHSKVEYMHNGVVITKQEYELANPPKKSYGDRKCFRVKLENLISLGC